MHYLERSKSPNQALEIPLAGLSGGQQATLAIARGPLYAPRIMFCLNET